MKGEKFVVTALVDFINGRMHRFFTVVFSKSVAKFLKSVGIDGEKLQLLFGWVYKGSLGFNVG